MPGDEILQCFHLCLHRRVLGWAGLQGTKRRHNGHQLGVDGIAFLWGTFGAFSLKFLVLRSCAPRLFCLVGVFFQFCGIKCGKIHWLSSCLLHPAGKVDQVFQALLFQHQQFHLLYQRLLAVKPRLGHDLFDVF